MSENLLKYAGPGIGITMGGACVAWFGLAFENPDLMDRGLMAAMAGTAVTPISVGVAYMDDKHKKP